MRLRFPSFFGGKLWLLIFFKRLRFRLQRAKNMRLRLPSPTLNNRILCKSQKKCILNFNLKNEDGGHLKQVAGEKVDLLHDVGQPHGDLLPQEEEGLGLRGRLSELYELFD